MRLQTRSSQLVLTFRYCQRDCKRYRSFSFSSKQHAACRFSFLRFTIKRKKSLFRRRYEARREINETLSTFHRLLRFPLDAERNRRFQRSILLLPREDLLPVRMNSFAKRVTRQRPPLLRRFSIGRQMRRFCWQSAISFTVTYYGRFCPLYSSISHGERTTL